MPTYITNTDVKRRTISGRNTCTPKREPICPPISTAIKSHVYGWSSPQTCDSECFIDCPINPDIELINMKKLAKAAIFFEGAAFDKCKTGEKKIPPPMPTNPDNMPKNALVGNKHERPNFVLVQCAVSKTSLCLISINSPAKSSDEPRIALNISWLIGV